MDSFSLFYEWKAGMEAIMFFQINKTNNYLSLNQKSIQSEAKSLFTNRNTASERIPKDNCASVRRSINLELRNAQKKQNNSIGNSIVESSLGYSETIRSGRLKSKSTMLAVKKLHYNFKSISSKLMRSKTSTSAREVASQAGREVLRLKRLKQNKDSDMEELDAAINHAKAMERLAKKKAAHLEEEELVKVAKSGGPCAGEVEEKDTAEKQDNTMQEENESLEEDFEGEEIGEELVSDTSQIYEAIQAKLEELMESMEENIGLENDYMDQFMDEMDDAMKELLEESGLGELLDEFAGANRGEMDPEDYKMMKIKHRCKELKDQAQADAEYLKAIFDQLEKQKGASAGLHGFTGGGESNAQSMATIPEISSAPAMSLPNGENHIDISL